MRKTINQINGWTEQLGVATDPDTLKKFRMCIALEGFSTPTELFNKIVKDYLKQQATMLELLEEARPKQAENSEQEELFNEQSASF